MAIGGNILIYRCRILALVTSVAIGLACTTLWGQDVSPSPEESVQVDILLQEQLDLAEKAPDRDTRLEHLRRALAIRPNHPDNLTIEFRIAVELSQRYDPQYPDQTPKRDEAFVVYEGLLKKYHHMDYYNSEPVCSSYDPQMMIPQAYVHLACLYRGLHGDSVKARDSLILAMECLKQTYEKRIEDWSNAPAPPKPDPNNPFAGRSGGRSETGKWEARMAHWNERRQKAAEGDAFGPLEMAVVKAAVRQYGYSHGNQKPYEVPVVMGEIIKMFPDTPMAEVAQEHIRRAVAMADEALYEELPEKLEESLADTPPSAPLGSTAVVDAPDSVPAPTMNDASSHAASSGTEKSASDGSRFFWPLLGLLTGCLIVAAVFYVHRRRN